MVGHIGAVAGVRMRRGGGGGGGGQGYANPERDKELEMMLKAQEMDDALVNLSSVQSVTKLVTDQGPMYAEICRLANTCCELDLSSAGKKLKFPGANVEESARIALENMNVLNESALEIASKHELNGKQFK